MNVAFVSIGDFFQKHIYYIKNIPWPLQYHAQHDFHKTTAYNITDPLCA